MIKSLTLFQRNKATFTYWRKKLIAERLEHKQGLKVAAVKVWQSIFKARNGDVHGLKGSGSH